MTLFETKKIFIVEDNEMYSMMLDYFLSTENVCRFISLKSGEECLENLNRNPDIVILDYGLPGINGYETLLEIKKRNPAIHVIILTEKNDGELAVKLLKGGADDYILKQENVEVQIIEKIQRLLSSDERKKSKSVREKLFYFILFLTLITLGIIWYII